MYRQGDILIIRVPASQVPHKALKLALEDGRLVLAHGEATGHAHVVEGEAELFARDGKETTDRFLKVRRRSHVVHDEHGTIELPRGTYKVIRQREHQPRDRSGRRRSQLVYD